jgi:hypothetical protein
MACMIFHVLIVFFVFFFLSTSHRCENYCFFDLDARNQETVDPLSAEVDRAEQCVEDRVGKFSIVGESVFFFVPNGLFHLYSSFRRAVYWWRP